MFSLIHNSPPISAFVKPRATKLAICNSLLVKRFFGFSLIRKDTFALDFLRQISTTARYVTSVCTGSMILAAAGLLRGYKATCHWAFKEQLAMLGVEVMNERIVIDRDRITGAGVTSGIDLGLTLVSSIWGESMAKMTQLMLEYDPKPPFNAGSLATVEPAIAESLLELGQPLIDAFLNCTKEIVRN